MKPLVFPLLVLLVCPSAPAAAEVLSFDDAPTDVFGNIVAPYGGFTWHGPGKLFEKLDGASFCGEPSPPGPGYCSGTVSGDFVAFNFDVGTLRRAEPFHFESVYINAGFRDDMAVEIEGYRDGELVYAAEVPIDTQGPTLYHFDFRSIDELVFRPAPPDNPGFGPHFILDDLVYSVVLTPEIDITPRREDDAIHPDRGGLIPVALLGSEDFDVARVDVTTLAFGPRGAAPKHDLTRARRLANHLRDLNGDGFLDLLSHYATPETGIVAGLETACLTGETLDGSTFEACTAIQTARAGGVVLARAR